MDDKRIPPAREGERLRWKLKPAPGTGELRAMVTLTIDYGADGGMNRTKAIMTKAHAEQLAKLMYEIIDAED